MEWTPIFNREPAMAAVSDTARSPLEQMAEFGAIAAWLLRADVVTPIEAEQIVEALQLCERTHGYPAIASGVRFAALAVWTGPLMTGASLTALAHQRGCVTAGLLFGALVEKWAGRTQRLTPRFPKMRERPRPASPHIEFDDCLLGSEMALRTGAEDGAAAAAALIAALRARFVTRAVEEIERTAAMLNGGGSPALVTALEGVATRLGADSRPPAWRHYARRAQRAERAA